ncbi:MAG: SOS response-associated peptidase family protein [Lachnospiraceae bacterium]|nr:SOS response-associated peptidase family protein [Lachnospiraceae bacterium]
MCGRYYLDDDTWDAVREDFPEIDPEYMRILTARSAAGQSGSGHAVAGRQTVQDVMPSMPAVSLTAGAAFSAPADPAAAGERKLSPAVLTWGFPGYDGGRLIINARAEGIQKKPTFAESIEKRRCVLPAAGFYEWDRAKQKVTFTRRREPVIYLAGIWRTYGDEARFVIITREANASMAPVHDRMPLMIDAKDVKDWLADPAETEKYLTRQLPELSAARDYEQMRFF